MRIVVRDAEWVIHRADMTHLGDYLLECEGISELVRGKVGRFLTEIENDPAFSPEPIRILDPAETVITEDSSPGFKDSLLFIESQLRQKMPTDEKIYFGHQAAMDPLPFQLDPTKIALKQPRQRLLIADAVGLGKTLEAGILLSELIRRGRGKRILVLAVKSMLTQFQKEMWSRFTIPLTRLDSAGIQRVRNRIPTNHNPFHYYDKAIISIDTLKQDVEYRHYLEHAYWDIIVIDEAHNVARRGSNSQRSKLAQLLSGRSDTLIMLSATPHDGKPESFASLVNMLDATAISHEKDYQHDDFSDKGLVVRRFKKDVKDQIASEFPERDIAVIKTRATAEEESLFRELAQAKFTTLDRGKSQSQLFRVTLEKALFSSPAACVSVVNNRLKRLQKLDDPQFNDDIDTLHSLAQGLAQITPDKFSKYQRLLSLIQDKKGGFGWRATQTDDRLVIFTESIATLNFLAQKLQQDLKLKPEQLGILHGQMADAELMNTVEEFGKNQSKLRLLVCSDVASEGINLHYLSYRMIHFDIPWSLMVFQQRNGRIDRYGQSRQPQIRYLITESSEEKIRGDSRILEVLIEKDDQAQKNIGDPSEFTKRYDQESEEELVAEVVGSQQTNGADILAALFDNNAAHTANKQDNPLASFAHHSPISHSDDDNATLPSLYSSQLAFATEALAFIQRKGQPIDYQVSGNSLKLTVNDELKQRMKWVTPEIYPKDDQFILTESISAITQEIAEARGEQHAWPRKHYLWHLHPVMEWLTDKMVSAFGRHHAPLIRMPTQLSANQNQFILSGLYPNRKGQAIIHEWIVITFTNQQMSQLQTLDEFLTTTPLGSIKLANPAKADNCKPQQQLLPKAIEVASNHFAGVRKEVENRLNQKLQQQMDALEKLRGERLEQLALQYNSEQGIGAIREDKKRKQERYIETVFDDYWQWIEETMTTEPQPYIQLIAVITGVDV
ncbi:DEAD/DEAH box helicase [Ectothiorhodospiraceae bacterium BW-2]|nr:DEAD/DEAH box helicase [Ectothiorhodospiraceae bacterium BW-2]